MEGRPFEPAARSPLAVAEMGAAVLLTGVAVVLHAIFLTNAGGLWRDEVNTLDFATMPSLSAIVASLRFDSFPLLPTLFLRAWIAAFGQSDSVLRVFGFLVGLGLLGSFWATTRMLGCRAPWLSLALAGLSPVVIRAVDSVRPYGLGAIGIVLTLGLLWRAVQVQTPRRFALAAIAAVFSVQCLYSNAFLLLAIGGAAFAAARAEDRRRVAIGIAAIGAAAAVSLLPYLPAIRASGDWSTLVQGPANLGSFGDALGGARGGWAWPIVTLLGIAALVRSPSPVARYGAIAWIAAAAVFLGVLANTKIPLQTWHYVPWIVVALPALDAGVESLAGLPGPRVTRLVLSLSIAAVALPTAGREIPERRTNVDLVAAYLGTHARSGDVVVVSPWYYGVSFQRYYKGPAPWSTLPPLSELGIHRYDLVKERMGDPTALVPAQEAMARALREGHRVWLVGRFPRVTSEPLPLPSPPLPGSGWSVVPYELSWGQQVSSFLRSHAERGEVVPPLAQGPVSRVENIPFIVVSGWR